MFCMEDDNEKFIGNIAYIPISEVQDKEVCVIEKAEIRISKKGEQSTHILKPFPLSRLRRVKEIPANDNPTIQIAHFYHRKDYPSQNNDSPLEPSILPQS